MAETEQTEITATIADDSELVAPGRGAMIGRFLVLDVLGAGGMGVVLSAYDPNLDRRVALKLLRSSALAQDRLVREAQTMARLSHENVVAVHEIGFAEKTAYVVMEQVAGRTLRAWLDEEPRSWREILSMVTRAGAGLAAAHRAGVIHRDVKPTNVLIGEDNRPRVADFGIASLDVTDGLVGGTRAYMAPEQAGGGAVDARADQFAFCVMAWEALQGQRPTTGERMPAQRRAPAWIFKALARGLAVDPETRWPTMDELLGALQPRAPGAALGIGLTAAVVAGAIAFSLAQRPGDPCAGSMGLVAPLWDEGTRARTAAAFGRTGAAHADSSFRSVDAALRARLATWAGAHRDVCEATRVRHEQSDTLMDLRMACLGQARSELRSFIAALDDIDADSLSRATTAASGVGDVAECSDTERLAAAPRPPADARLAKLQDDLAAVHSLGLLGKLKAGHALAIDALARARELAYGPALSRALLEIGRLEVGSVDVDAGIAHLQELLRVGSEARADEDVARGLGELIFAYGSRKQRFEAADALYEVALGAVARAGYGTGVVRQLFNYRSHVMARKGEWRACLFLRLNVLAMTSVDEGSESPATGLALSYVASAVGRLPGGDGAPALYARSLAILEKTVGEESPWFLGALGNLAGYHIDTGSPGLAAPILDRVLALEERTLGPGDRALTGTLEKLAAVRIHERRLDEARALATRSLGIASEREGATHPDVADAKRLLAEVAHLSKDARGAHALYAEALAVEEATYGKTSPQLAGTLVADASALVDLGDVASARAAIDRAKALDMTDHGETRSEDAEVLLAEAAVLRAEGQTAAAVTALRKAAGLADTADPHIALCEALLATGDPAAAAESAEHATRLADRAPPDVADHARECLSRARR